ncbi:unnamed protein product, partial [Rotaria sp. Silwood2]
HEDSYKKADNVRADIYCIIWLDHNVNSNDTKDTEQKLVSLRNRIEKFQNTTHCLRYIEKLSEKDRLVIIASGRLGKEITPPIHELPQVTSIYVYCMNKKFHEQWACKFAKVKLS